ncbi:hypothetical protein LOK49_LG02G02165 [Camellia lanceoleosa]|uniref:Uncharacterized protein n=1 Tax=Camellia lanceoleosa TaxID=1840588 RepID=A0ACC0ILX7_9ERIC|nr:hypothetical protein LOK49_LG02G02165 [Camellia lanceoleosa]
MLAVFLVPIVPLVYQIEKDAFEEAEKAGRTKEEEMDVDPANYVFISPYDLYVTFLIVVAWFKLVQTSSRK